MARLTGARRPGAVRRFHAARTARSSLCFCSRPRVVRFALARRRSISFLSAGGAHLVAAHDRFGALGLRGGVRGDALLLLDRLRQALMKPW